LNLNCLVPALITVDEGEGVGAGSLCNPPVNLELGQRVSQQEMAGQEGVNFLVHKGFNYGGLHKKRNYGWGGDWGRGVDPHSRSHWTF
jgi:hypothetical protein